MWITVIVNQKRALRQPNIDSVVLSCEGRDIIVSVLLVRLIKGCGEWQLNTANSSIVSRWAFGTVIQIRGGTRYSLRDTYQWISTPQGHLMSPDKYRHWFKAVFAGQKKWFENVMWYSETFPVGTLRISRVGRVLIRHQSDTVNLYANHILELTISIIRFFLSWKGAPVLWFQQTCCYFYLPFSHMFLCQTWWNPLLAFCSPSCMEFVHYFC